MEWSRQVKVYDELESTMGKARDLVRAGEAGHGTTVVAKHQTTGRGRRGRTWHSPRGGLWMTVVLVPSRRPFHTLGLVVGMAVWEAVRDLGVENVGLKWPNDLLVTEGAWQWHKLCGILLEADTSGGQPVAYAGIGLNVSAHAEAQVPEELADRYVGIQDLGASCAAQEVCDAVVPKLERWVGIWETEGMGPIVNGWGQCDVLRGARVRADTEEGRTEGVADGLSAEGALRVKTEAGLHLVQTGEIHRVTVG